MPLQEYCNTVVTWGMASAGFNAARAIRQCAVDEAAKFPIGAEVVLNDFYMDDMLSGADDEQQLLQVYREAIAILQCGGFQLAKFITNCPILAAEINQSEDAELAFPDESGVLGMRWLPRSDELKLKILQTPPKAGKITKKVVVSRVAQIFDPSGLFAPFIVLGKSLIQSLWRRGVGWDEKLPDDLHKEWTEFMEAMDGIDRIRVPRWIAVTNQQSVELHVFADASEKAYGAVAYIRVMNQDGSATANVLTAKSRVAPVKKLTIPRLELQAAKIAAELGDFVKRSCKLIAVPTVFWTDSSIVLYWLRRDPHLNKPFVANRVSSILELSAGAQWRHVSSE